MVRNFNTNSSSDFNHVKTELIDAIHVRHPYNRFIIVTATCYPFNHYQYKLLDRHLGSFRLFHRVSLRFVGCSVVTYFSFHPHRFQYLTFFLIFMF